MKQLLHLFSISSLLFSMAVSAQVEIPDDEESDDTPEEQVSPTVPTGPTTPNPLDFLTDLDRAAPLAGSRGECSFTPVYSDNSDSGVLTEVMGAMQSLRSTDQCRAVTAPALEGFQTAMAAYRRQMGLDQPRGQPGNLNVTCGNYQSIYDSQFEAFVDNPTTPPPMGTDPYASCRALPNSEARIACAGQITGTAKSRKEQQCNEQRAAIRETGYREVTQNTYNVAMASLMTVLNNQDCIDGNGSQRLSFLQTAFRLTTRAAALPLAGTGLGVLIAGATELAESALTNLFRRRSERNDPLAISSNLENFTRTACLYEKIESKALRCGRVVANQRIEAATSLEETAIAACADGSNVLGSQALIANLNSSIQRLIQPVVDPNQRNGGSRQQQSEEPPPPRAISEEEFEGLAQSLSAPYPSPGNTESHMQIGERSAREVLASMEADLADVAPFERIKARLRTEGNANPSNGDVRRERARLDGQREMVSAVMNVMGTIQAADAKPEVTVEDRQGIHAAFAAFEGKSYNFATAFNQVMLLRAAQGGDLGTQIQAFNNTISEVSGFQQVIQYVENQRSQVAAPVDDANRLTNAKDAIKPHLQRLMNREVEQLNHRIGQTLITLPANTRATGASLENLTTQEENNIYPLLRACNQLQGLSMRTDRGGRSSASSANLPASCQAFRCADGLKTFEDHLASITPRPAVNASECNDLECKGQFDRFICQQTQANNLNAMRSRIKNELLTNGTICGKSMSEAFGGGEGRGRGDRRPASADEGDDDQPRRRFPRVEWRPWRWFR